MGKKPSPSKTTTSKIASKKSDQKAMPKIKSTPDKVSQKKAIKSSMDNLTILKNSPYLKQSAKTQAPKKDIKLKELFEKNRLSNKEEKMKIVLSGQYQEALDLIYEADASNLYPILVGSPGIGKTTLCRYYAQSRAEITGNDSFEWITFDGSTKLIIQFELFFFYE